jgi:hypothetical protein
MRILPLDYPMPILSVRGVMLYPSDTPRDRENASSFADYHLKQTLSNLQRDGGDIPDGLKSSLQTCAELPKDFQKRIKRGAIAGELFKVVFELVLNDREKASWQNAYRILSRLRKQNGTVGSERMLRGVRDQFLSVCHLWAALDLREHKISGMDDFHAFLNEAEALRFHGQHWRHTRDKSKPLLPDDLWCPPKGWQPPANAPGIAHYSIDPSYKDHIRSAGRPVEKTEDREQ